MSRTVSWRNKPTALISQMLPVANQYKLYLIHETGPTSFVFKDDNDNKFKVSIGGTVSCSCGIVQGDHCLHTLYVLLKKFKVPPTNPIIWQASYLDSELQGFIHLKYAQKKKQTFKKHQFKRNAKTTTTTLEADDFPQLEEDAMCPICYEDMNGQCYSSCKVCKKSLHTKCFKIWTRHKEDSNVAVTCPMCRAEFQNPMTIIYKDLERWEARFSTHKGTLCRGCGMKNIKGTLYKCLLCSGADLCKLCFDANQHRQHDRFFIKTMANEPWKIIPPRVKRTKKQLLQVNKQIVATTLNEDKSQQFIIDLFPTLKDYNSSQSTADLGIVGNEILPKQLCFRCKTGGNELMRRLFCGHSLHEECLRSMLRKEEYLCDIDNQPMASGYFQALGVKICKPKKKTVECVVLKNQEAINRIQGNFNKLEVQGMVSVPKQLEKRNVSVGGQMSKSRDRNFRIMKKSVVEKREDLPFGSNNLGLIMVTGFGQQMNPQLTAHSLLEQQHQNNFQQKPPRFKSNMRGGR